MASVEKPAKHRSLVISDVEDLGQLLVRMADAYPLQYRTERDFLPLVRVFLEGRVPSVVPEVGSSNKKVDFRIGGTNPAVLELAVAPRALIDPNWPGLKFAGHTQSTQLYASQNKTELNKLGSVPKTRARNRYLLLLDLGRGLDLKKLKKGYVAACPKNGKCEPIRVVYSGRRKGDSIHFQVGGKQVGRPKASP